MCKESFLPRKHDSVFVETIHDSAGVIFAIKIRLIGHYERLLRRDFLIHRGLPPQVKYKPFRKLYGRPAEKPANFALMDSSTYVLPKF